MANLSGNAAYYVAAILIGAAVGLVGSAFHLGVDALAHGWPSFLDHTLGLDGVALYAAAAVVAAVMALVALWLVRRFAPEAAGSGVPEIEGAMEGLREVHWRRVLPVKFFGGLLALSSGMVLGREGPTIHIGASIAKGVSDLMGWTARDMRGLLAAGGAAGLAAAFNAPLAAVLFVIEETRRQFPYSARTYIAVVLSSIASAIATESITGNVPFMLLVVPDVPMGMYPLFVLLGVILGAVGVGFNRTLVWSLDTVRRIGLRWSFYIFPAVVGLVVGVLVFALPEATKGGEILAVELAKEGRPLGILALIVLLRFTMTMASYSTGVTGGIFAPILALATTIGLCYGTAIDTVMPLPEHGLQALAIAAMGGLFSATIGAPMVGVVLVMELTGSYGILVPVLLTTIFANMVAQWLGGRPIYEILLDRTLALEAQASETPPAAPAPSPAAAQPQEAR
ncbi:H(+)/Cl(-) exchange transporter ClcA [Ancylobacter mangrovi]|uniref:H(+)/Cl(-) exchange transporter ClcA n=1 Tax=Ancylobacter mangrovi TaxID=2972472 RepID=UPI002163F4D4|nr:H(+)/Cl(-) exchange transporter ClcA [Ancylobacter mangrovi]MCS0501019.1 H(+)/Cl(-) exchange transporter ClcA [Ancylobacter mangrovi]